MADYREGQTATNPKTGQKLIFRGGQWVAFSQPGAAPQEATLTGDARNQAMQKIAALEALRRQVGASQGEYDKTLKGVGIGSVLEYLPGIVRPSNARFDATVDAMTPLARAAFRVPGSGSDSDRESDAFMRLLPNRWEADAGNEQKYKQMNDIINSSIASQKRLLGGGMFGATSQTQRQVKPLPSKVIDFNDLPE